MSVRLIPQHVWKHNSPLWTVEGRNNGGLMGWVVVPGWKTRVILKRKEWNVTRTKQRRLEDEAVRSETWEANEKGKERQWQGWDWLSSDVRGQKGSLQSLPSYFNLIIFNQEWWNSLTDMLLLKVFWILYSSINTYSECLKTQGYGLSFCLIFFFKYYFFAILNKHAERRTQVEQYLPLQMRFTCTLKNKWIIQQ